MAKVSSLLIFVPISAWFLVIYLVYSPSEGNLIDDRFRERRSHLKSVCAKYSPEVFRTTQDVLLNKPKNESRFEGLSIYQLEHILVDHKHKVLYCYVPKVGSSNWKRVFLMLRGQSNVENPMEIPVPKVHDPSNHQSLKSLDEKEMNRALNEYRKFLFVRHPFERLLSAFRNKLESRRPKLRPFHERIGGEIIRMFRESPSRRALREGDDVTFYEFVQYLMSEGSLTENAGQNYNEHWEPIHNLCSPCTIPYDYIGRFDTMVEDANAILDKINAKGVRYPEKTSDTWALIGNYYDEIPTKFIRGLEEVYKMDMVLFNYTMEEVLGIHSRN